jgi:tRNA(Ile)-lysidine synthase
VFDQAVARFITAANQLVPENGGTAKFALAVSGGPDSLALLLLGHAAFPDRVLAATVDHGLRPESAKEAEFVAAICAARGVPHVILRPEHAIIGNLQSAARTTRYALLQDWARSSKAAWIATAHHSDDQLETLLMRVIRGSGVDGLASIRAHNGNVIRPLLGFSKAELATVCEDRGITAIIDPSNESDNFDRVRLRKWLAESAHPFDPEAANRSALALGQASDALLWMTDQLASERIIPVDSDLTLDPNSLPRELQRRLLIRILRRLCPNYVARGEAIERCLNSLLAGETVTLGAILCRGGKIWHFRLAPKRRNG